MRKYLYDYIKKIDGVLKDNKKNDWEKIKKEHLIKISFFQHERFIHLIVTLFFALLMLIFLALISLFELFAIIALIIIIILIFYIFHYFKLENGVQYLYKQYEEIVKKIEK